MQLEQLSNYKETKMKIKKGNDVEKVKAAIRLPRNHFFWRDIVEKATLLIREHI